MATNFPTSLDTFTNPNSGNTLDSPSHSVQHSDINDAVEAIEAKLGVGSSTAGSATAGYALVNTSGGTTAYSLLGVAGLSSGTADANTVLTADGSGGVAFNPLSSAGLVFISSTTIGSTVSSISLPDNTFTSTYDNYRVIFDCTRTTAFSTDTNMIFKFRASGTDSVTGYEYQGWQSTGATLANGTGGTLPDQFMGSVLSSTPTRFLTVIDIAGIYVATETKYLVHNVGMSGGTRRSLGFNGFHTVATAYDSMTFGVASGTMSGGRILVYGFSN